MDTRKYRDQEVEAEEVEHDNTGDIARMALGVGAVVVLLYWLIAIFTSVTFSFIFSLGLFAAVAGLTGLGLLAAGSSSAKLMRRRRRETASE